MVYALIGIPLTMLLLTAVVERLLIPTTLMLKWMNTKLGHLHTPFFIRVLHLFIVSGQFQYSFSINSCNALYDMGSTAYYKAYQFSFTDRNDDNRISLSPTSGNIHCS